MQTKSINMDKKLFAPRLRAPPAMSPGPQSRPGATADPDERSGRVIGFDRETSLDGNRFSDLT
jgi:hypothetical protein